MLHLKAVNHEVFDQNWFILNPYSDMPQCVLSIHGGKGPHSSSVTWPLRSTIHFLSITWRLMRKPLVSAKSPSPHVSQTLSLAKSLSAYLVFLLYHMLPMSCPYVIRLYQWPTAALLSLNPYLVACLACLWQISWVQSSTNN